MVIVRSEQHLHLSGGLSVGIEERFHVGLVIFQVTAGFLLRRAAEVGFREILMCYQYTTEKLVLESDPVQGLCNLFGFGTGFTQIIRSLVLYFIRQGRITAFEIEAFFLLACHFIPCDVQRFHGRCEEIAQAVGPDGKVDHVGMGQQRVIEIQRTSSGSL